MAVIAFRHRFFPEAEYPVEHEDEYQEHALDPGVVQDLFLVPPEVCLYVAKISLALSEGFPSFGPIHLSHLHEFCSLREGYVFRDLPRGYVSDPDV